MLYLEWLIILTLVIGLLYFVFDVKSYQIAALVCNIIALVVIGCFIAVGIKITNLIFGW